MQIDYMYLQKTTNVRFSYDKHSHDTKFHLSEILLLFVLAKGGL